MNFRYCVEVDYESWRNCGEDIDGYNPCSPICRCSTIEEAKVTSADPAEIARRLCDRYFPRVGSKLKVDKMMPGPADAYVIERLLAREGVFSSIDPDDWEIETVGGYYGEEIGSVTLSAGKADEIEALVAPFLGLPVGEQIAALLSAERGYSHEELASLNWSVERVLLKKIGFIPIDTPAERYRYYYGRSSELPLAVTVATESGFHLVDGRERLSVAFHYGKEHFSPKPGKRARPFKVPVLVGRVPGSP